MSQELLIHSHKVISRGDVNDCVKNLDEALKEDQPRFLLRVKGPVEDVDILLIAYFTLYKLKKPALEIEIILDAENKGRNDLIYKLRQYRAHAFLSTPDNILVANKDIFKVTFTDGTSEQDFPFPEDWFDFSTTFAPLLLVTQETLNPLFFNPLEKPSAPGFSPQFNTDNNSLFGNYKTALLNTIHSPEIKYKTAAIGNLGFWEALRRAKILNFFLCEDDNFEGCTSSMLSPKNSVEYFKTCSGNFY